MKVFKLLLSFTFLFCANLAFSQDIVVEAESGTRNGTTTATASGVTYVTGLDADGDSFTITVNAPNKGTYVVTLRYRSEAKTQDLLLNGVFVSNIALANTNNAWANIDLGGLMLKAGANTVTIRKNWGWSDFDKFTFTPVPPHDYSTTVATPINPNTNQKTKDVYDWLRSNYGTNIVSGQTAYWNELITIAKKTPVIRAFDFQHYTVGYAYLWDNGCSCQKLGWEDDGTTKAAIDWYNSTNGKGIVTFQWHWHPALNSQAGKNTFYTNQTTFDVTKAVTNGTPEYTSIIRDIDSIATQLKRLQTAGVPVLWRPLHEAGGAWFWWGAKGSAACLQLYDIMYDRLTNHHKLNNLIWVWASPEKDWYPGNAKVDIFGYDSYPGDFVYGTQKTIFDDMFKTCNGEKMIAMTENGPIPTIDDCISEDAMWLYFSTWSDHAVTGNSATHIEEVYAHTKVITLDVVVLSVPITITPYTQINGGTWNLTNTATVCAGENIMFGPWPNVETGWAWTGPNGFTATTRAINFTNIASNKTGNYVATYTDASGNKGTQTFTITVNDLPAATVNTTTASNGLANGSIKLSFTDNPARTNISFSIDNGATYTSVADNIGTYNFTAVTAGKYKVYTRWGNAECPVYLGEFTVPASLQITLAQGWNLISTNLHPADSTIETLFIGLDVAMVKDMNGFWKKGQVSVLNSLKTITAGQGYLVNMNTAGTLTITGTVKQIHEFALQSGWYLIGCPFQTTTAFSSEFNATNCQTIKNFDGFWVPNGAVNSIQDFEVGKGYFLKR